MVVGAGEGVAQVLVMGVSDPPIAASLHAPMEDPPITASLGPIDRLICRLKSLEGSKHTLPVGLRVNQIRKLREHLEKFRKPLKNLSEIEDTSFRAKWWMKEVRELCYEIEDYLVQSGDGGPRTLARIARIIISWIHSKLKWRTRLSKFIAHAEVLEKTGESFIDREIEAAISLKKEMKADISLEKQNKVEIETLPAILVSMLAFEDEKQTQLKLVAISGYAGSGKTTLARTLYVDCKKNFQCSAFVRVSRNQDFRSLLISVLSQIKAPSSQGLCGVQDLVCSISDHLQGKRYFIVIDDIWSPSVWDIISRAFPGGNFRSRIIVTTQSEQVEAAYSGYKLKFDIFKMGATNDGCTHTTTEWKSNVLNTRYNNLPLHLKTCLLYFSMYPEGWTITKDDLAKQWVGEGFIAALKRHCTDQTSEVLHNNREKIAEGPQDERGEIAEVPQDNTEETAEVPKKEIENIAQGYFDELVSRGMILPVDINHKGEVLSCTVHHMVLDLIRYKSKEDNFIVVVDNLQSTLGHPDTVRRMSVQFGCEKGASIPENLILSKVRSLTFHGFIECVPSIADCLLLRVLILNIFADEDKIFDLSTIGELYHLRYLKIECNITVRLPSKIRKLQHLGTLELHAEVESIPSDIGHLKKLVHIRCPGKTNVHDLVELTNLLELQLTWSTVENQQDDMECLRSILEKISSLRCLALVPASGSSSVNTLPANPPIMCISCDSLCILSPAPENLQRLELSRRCCILSRLPNWIGELGKLCILKIAVRELSEEDIDILKRMPALDALSLHVQPMSAERIVFGKEGFTVLTYFKFTCTVPWLGFEADAMPNLAKLKLCFNSPIVDEQGTTRIIIIGRLSGLKEISAIIGSAGVGAGSAWRKAIKNDSRNPEVQLMGSIYYGDQDREMETPGRSGEADNRVHVQRESSCLPVPAACHREEEPEDQPFIPEIISTPSKSESTDGHSDQVMMHGKPAGGGGSGRALGRDDGHSGGGGGAHGSGSSLGTEGGVNAGAAPPPPRPPLNPQAPATLGSAGLGSRLAAINTNEPGFTDPDKTVKNISTRYAFSHHVPRMRNANLMVGVKVSMVTGVMYPLIGKLRALMGDEYKFKELHRQASFLAEDLSAMTAALHEIELMDELDPEVKEWRDHVREMSYDMENCIDDFMRKFKHGDDKAGFFTNIARALKSLRQHHQITDMIKELKNFAIYGNAQREMYKINDWKPSSSSVAVDPRLGAIYQEAASLVGIDFPMEDLANLLADTQKKLKVLSIVGFGGLGKTTLAKQLYDKFRGKFHCEAFFSVSQRPDIKVILNRLKDILHITRSSHACVIHDIIEDIREHLKEKRYLIVVDDLWDQPEWNIIKCAFPNEGNGSRVIVTTRVEDVARIACHKDPECIYRMKLLNNHNSRMLFFDRVFGSGKKCPPYLEEVSTDILKKCGGLPLAIITVASLLASQEGSRTGWENIRSSLDTQTNRNPTLEDMENILNLSYMHLPHHLRACFLYLGMYPEKEEIRISDVIREWVAEGLVSNLCGFNLIDVGKSYFNELINRSMIRPARTENGEVVSCRVHDIMLNLILSKCAENNFLSVASSSEDITRLQGCQHKVHRLSLRSMAVGATNGLDIGGSFLSQVRSCAWAKNSMPPLLLFKYVRVLTLDGDYHGLTIDLTAISRLFLLRYLRVVATHGVVELPSALKGLVYMETLDLIAGYSANSFPSDIIHLPRLSYLNLPRGAPAIQGVENMKSLRTLHWFDLDNNSENDIRALGELTNLRELSFCGSVETSKFDALVSTIGKLHNLKHLNTGTSFVTDWHDQLGLLSSSPFQYIEKLMLEDWEFPRVPRWMCGLCCLRVLYLRALETSTEDVQVLGMLPSLVCLDFSVIKIAAEHALFGKGVFPVLEQFRFWPSNGDVMKFLVFEEGAMPKLRTLALMVDEWVGSTPVGMEHLILLKKIRLYASPDAKFLLSSWTKDDLVCAFTKASQLHRNRLSVVVISFAGSKF